MIGVQMSVAAEEWPGDVLGRKKSGDFLYRLIQQTYKANHTEPGTGALCLAIDADWGAGKTFFVKRWSADVETLEHPVVRFDAWANDLADDPLLGFMSRLKLQLEPFLKQLPLVEAVRDKVAAKLKAVFVRAPSAVLPVLAVLGKGAIRWAAKVEPDELVDALTGGIDPGALKEMSQESMQTFFDLAMKAHNDKQSAIQALKESIESLLKYLDEQQAIQLPLYVFIDELDRCRPDYAVRLLEGIKHLFDAQGVCFVFSTNLKQLSASAQAVYGANFDAYRYLKRFFTFEYRLPEPDYLAYAKLLAINSQLPKRNLAICSGLPKVQGESSQAIIAANFAFITEAFELDLRSQAQVFRHAEAAASGIADGARCHCFYLYFLAAALHRGSLHSDAFAPSYQIESADFKTLKANAAFAAHYKVNDSNGRQVSSKFTLLQILSTYHQLSILNIGELQQRRQAITTVEYPTNITEEVASEVVSVSGADRLRRGPLSNYHELVRAAGQLVDPPEV